MNMDLIKFCNSWVQFADQNSENWNELDAGQGDGDLGVTMYLGAKALAEAALQSSSIKDWFLRGGKAVRIAAPSTMGFLLASALIAAGKMIDESKTKLQLEDWRDIQYRMVEEIQKRGRAQLGDKTVLDVLIPAAQTFRDELHKGKETEQILAEASAVAKQCAEQTAALVSRIGRSSWLGERSQGNIDGGAWVCSQIYGFIFDYIRKETTSSPQSLQ